MLALGLASCLLPGTTILLAAELRPETLNAWNSYLILAQARMAARIGGDTPFLWVDEVPDRLLRVKSGEIDVAPVKEGGSESVPHGLIHDWVGAAFIPNTTIAQVRATLRDYDRYKEIFPPTVVSSRVIDRSDDTDRYSVRWVNKVLFVNAGIDADCLTKGVPVDEHRYYTASYATKLLEIQNYGHADERDLPPDQGSGYLWRLYSFARFEERDGGVYLEIEALALTRDIPTGLRFLVGPEVKKLSHNSLLLSLQQSRAAVTGTPALAAPKSLPRQDDPAAKATSPTP